MKKYILAAIATLGLPVLAHADTILTFGQRGEPQTVFATENAAHTQTTILSSDATISVTQILAGSPVPENAFFDLNIHSIDAAVPIGKGASQHYSGTFSIFSGIGKSGTDFLSGSFDDILLGVGPSGVLAAGDPPDAITFTSGIIKEQTAPRGIALSFANITPEFAILGTSVRSFTSSVSGTFSAAAAAPVPEPASLALLGVGLLGIGYVQARRRFG